jgi:hypothetical protein
MKDLIRNKYHMEYELVPPGCHRRNAAKVAIRNFKAHFLSVLAGVSNDFPLYLWDKLLPQTEITQSNATPTISAYAHLKSPFDYNKMPLAPMGCNVQVHEKADSQGTWSFHSVDGWYIDTSPKHYRTHRCHIKITKSHRFSDTVDFQHKQITDPTVSHADKVMNTISSCIKTIQGMSAFKSNDDLRQLHNVLKDTTADPTKLHRLIQQACNHQQPVPRVDTPNPPVPRVPIPTPDDQQITRAMMQQLAVPHHNPGVPTPPSITYQAIPPRPHRKKRRAPANSPNTPDDWLITDNPTNLLRVEPHNIIVANT